VGFSVGCLVGVDWLFEVVELVLVDVFTESVLLEQPDNKRKRSVNAK
jgi:hypothetical protein